MRAPMILLCLLIVLFLIGQIRLGCKVVYDQDGVQVFVRFGAFRIRVFPMKKDSGESKSKKPKKEKKKKPKKEKPPKEPVPLKEKVGGALDYARELLPVLLDAVKYFFHKLQIDTLHLTLIAGSSDPADAASLYGKASAALGAVWYPMVEAFDVKDGYARVDLDFDSPKMTLCAEAALSIKIGQLLWLVLYFGIRAGVRFLKERGRQKKLKQAEKGGLTHGKVQSSE